MPTDNPRGPTPHSGTHPVAIARKARLARILEMRRAGRSLEEIGAKENIGRSRVHAIIAEGLRKAVALPARELINLQLARLDELLSAFYPQALAGDRYAVDRVLAIMEKHDKLLGLNAPDKREEVGDAADAKAALLEKLAAMAARIEGAAAAEAARAEIENEAR